VALVALLTAGAAYGVVSSLAGSGSQRPTSGAGARPWLGIAMTSSPFGGVTITDVQPGSPAAAAGLEPGDVLTEIGTQPISGSADVAAAIAGTHAGDQVQIQVHRGPLTYNLPVTLATRAAGAP
jgi:S1-C subfamily serine protease